MTATGSGTRAARQQLPPPAALYRRLLGARFEALPRSVRELHDVTEASRWRGRADVERGRGLVALLVARLLGLPPDGRDQALDVTFEPVEGGEIWTRTFGTSVFRSVQDDRGGLLRERAGPVAFLFAFEASGAGLALNLRSIRVLGVPLPRLAHPHVRTFESERDGRYRFDVEGSLPLAGMIVRYAGWLERAGPESA